MTTQPPLATLASQTASLTVALFDASSATDWTQTKAAATKAQFTGHPAEVMRGLGKGDEVATIDVGASGGFAFELEGTSGRLEIYGLAGGGLALVAPPRAWWLDPARGGGDHAAAVDALFAEALAANAADDGTELGELELTTDHLAVVYIWHRKVGAARELAATMPAGVAITFGDGYGDGHGGAVVNLGRGTYRLVKRELDAPWPPKRALAVTYLVRV